MNRNSRLLAYAWAPLTLALAIGARLATEPVFGVRGTYTTLFLAVLCSALFGGAGPGLLAAALGALGTAYFLIPPYYSFKIAEFEHVIGIVLFGAVSLITIVLVERQRKAKALAQQRRAQLETEIRERRRAEEAEKLHREWFEVTLASIGDGVITTDTHGRVTFMNPVASGLTGWAAEDATGQAIEDVFRIHNEETDARVESPLTRVIRERRVVGLANHTVLISKEGKRIPIGDSGAPIRNSAGEVLGAVLVFRDMSEARAREVGLRERDRMIDFAHDAIIVTDANRRITRWNNGARELYGWEEAEARGKLLHELLKTGGSHTLESIEEILQKEGRWDGLLIHVCKEGRTVISESRQVLLRDARGGRTGMLEINRDATARVQAERDLKRAAAEAEEGRRTLETLMRHIPEGITIADAPDVRIRMVSRYGASLAGRPNDMLENLKAAEQPSAWGLYHPDGSTLADPEELPLTRAVRRGESVTDEEWLIKRPDGETVSILCNAGPIRDAEGRITGGLIAWRDITQRKRLEQKVREAARLESVGVLAGGVAHDFNNLLTGILGNATLLQEDAQPGTPEAMFAQSIASAAERAAKLTQQMLAYSGRGRFVIEPVDVSALIEATVALIRSSIPKTAELRLNLAVNLPMVEADAAQLQQLIMNLVVNAGEAIGERAGRITVATRPLHLDEETIASVAERDDLQPGPYVMLEVHDTGCGMDDQMVSRIFDPFFTTKFTGRGLGLAAAQGIVRGHNGAIEVQSVPGTGTTFRVLLPAAETARTMPLDPAQESAAVEGAGTVLLIDDEEVVRSTAKATLEKLGFDVVLACHGKEAVEALRSVAPQVRLVILDVTMPGISGEETLRELRQIRADVPVIVSSGFSEMEALRRFGNHRLEGFLQKPYTVRGLAEKVKAATTTS